MDEDEKVLDSLPLFLFLHYLSLNTPGVLVAQGLPSPLSHQVDPKWKNMKTENKSVLYKICKCLDNSVAILYVPWLLPLDTEGYPPLCPAWSCLGAPCCPGVQDLPQIQAFLEDPPLPETQRNNLKTSI